MEDDNVGCFLLTGACAFDVGCAAEELDSFLFLLLLPSAAAVSVVAMTGRATVVVVVADFLLDSNAAASRARKLSVF